MVRYLFYWQKIVVCSKNHLFIRSEDCYLKDNTIYKCVSLNVWVSNLDNTTTVWICKYFIENSIPCMKDGAVHILGHSFDRLFPRGQYCDKHRLRELNVLSWPSSKKLHEPCAPMQMHRNKSFADYDVAVISAASCSFKENSKNRIRKLACELCGDLDFRLLILIVSRLSFRNRTF